MLLARARIAALAVTLVGLAGGCDAPTSMEHDAYPPLPTYDGGTDARQGTPDASPDASPDARTDLDGPYEDICGPMPQGCENRLCVTSIHFPTYEDCCDSTYCNCDPVDHTWETIACDPPPPPDGGTP